MTPEAKAEELRKKYLFALHDLQAIEIGTNLRESSKQLATICCDEVLSVLQYNKNLPGPEDIFSGQITYYQKVKQHIQSL